MAQREFAQYYPRDGWVEHDPEEIWTTQRSVMIEALAKKELPVGAIAAVGITNQRETTLVWDRATGRTIYPAIVWQDRRTAQACRRFEESGLGDMVAQKTGLRLDPYFSGLKVAWILDNVEGARERAERGELAFGTVDSWLIWNLTDGKAHVTDATNASRTMLFNIHSLEWDEGLLEALRIPPSLLPEVRSCSELYGRIGREHLPGNLPISGSAGDQHAALFGQSCYAHGMAKNTYGTGCFLLMNTGRKAVPSQNNLLTTLAWKLGNATEYALEGSVFVGGAVIQWLRDELGIISSAPECDRIAATAEDNGGVYIVPAFAGLGAPYWDPEARGTILGLTRGANKKHLCRAAIESIAYQSADVLNAMRADSDLELTELRADGGAARSDLLLQFQADVLGVRVVRPQCIETTALGAAYLAGLAVGYWTSREEISHHWSIDRIFEPQRSREDMAKLLRDWARAVERSRNWAAND